MAPVKTVDAFIERQVKWKTALRTFRGIFNQTELEETIKWGVPVYVLQGKNIAGMAAFKSYVGIWFYQGVFLKDPYNKLINAQEGTTKAMRQLRFASEDEVDYTLVKEYIAEAIQNQKDGKEMKPDTRKPLVIPGELQKALEEMPTLKEAFDALSLTKRRDYAEYISMAKREATKTARLEKIVPMIEKGIGLHDKYNKPKRAKFP